MCLPTYSLSTGVCLLLLALDAVVYLSTPVSRSDAIDGPLNDMHHQKYVLASIAIIASAAVLQCASFLVRPSIRSQLCNIL